MTNSTDLLLKVPNHEMLLCRIDTPALLAEKHFTVLSVQPTNVSISLGKSSHTKFQYDGNEFNYILLRNDGFRASK